MNSDKSVIAHFSQVCYSLSTSVDPSGSGSVSVSPSPNCAGGKYTSGTQVQLTANPASGYSFAYWSGDASGSANPTTITMNSDKSVIAHFKPETPPPTHVWVEPLHQTVALYDGPFTADVMIRDVVNLGAFEFELRYDPTIVHVDDVVLGEFLGSTGRTTHSLGPIIDNEAGTAAFGAATSGPQPGPDGSGMLATIHLSPRAFGTSDLHLQDLLVLDTGGDTIPVSKEDSRVTVLLCFGDVDGDGDVDARDIMEVASRWRTSCAKPDPDNNPDTPNYDPLYDINKDGVINIVDIMLVVAHWGEICF